MGNLQPVEYNNQRILTTAQIAVAYSTDAQTIHRNFHNNKGRYTVGKHYFLLEGENLKSFLNLHLQILEVQNPRKIRTLYLWTEKGALMHAKSLNTDKAWEAYERLIDEYYRLIQPSAPPTYTASDALRLRAFANEDRVPHDLFSTQLELARELHYWEGLLNEKLDNKSEIEKSVGKHFSNYARNDLRIPDSERRTYRHRLASGRMVDPWAYPLRYLPDFRHWLREVYFPKHFEAYARYRARRIGAPVPQIAAPKKRITTSGTEQLQLF
jgi:hypothetical protein